MAWSAKVASAGVSSGSSDHLDRAIQIALFPDEHDATGICLKTMTEREVAWDGSAWG